MLKRLVAETWMTLLSAKASAVGWMPEPLPGPGALDEKWFAEEIAKVCISVQESISAGRTTRKCTIERKASVAQVLTALNYQQDLLSGLALQEEARQLRMETQRLRTWFVDLWVTKQSSFFSYEAETNELAKEIVTNAKNCAEAELKMEVLIAKLREHHRLLLHAPQQGLCKTSATADS